VSKTVAAIGRMFLHAMLDKQEIISTSMIDLIRNAIFLSARPDDEECYCSADLMNSLKSLSEKDDYDNSVGKGYTFDNFFGDGDKEKITKESYPKYLQKRAKLMLDVTKSAINAMKKGVTLGGRFNIGHHLYGIPVEEVLVKFIFSSPKIEAEDLRAILRMKSVPKTGSLPEESTILHETQSRFFNCIMPEIISEWENFERIQFVTACTGHIAIPYIMSQEEDGDKENDFTITIEFNGNETSGDDDLPVFHTCVNTIKLPFTAYDASKEKFLLKLDKFYTFGGAEHFSRG